MALFLPIVKLCGGLFAIKFFIAPILFKKRFDDSIGNLIKFYAVCVYNCKTACNLDLQAV